MPTLDSMHLQPANSNQMHKECKVLSSLAHADLAIADAHEVKVQKRKRRVSNLLNQTNQME